jgi:hypothetical protein
MRTAIFEALSPYDFEQLVQDLIHAQWGVQVESFMAGRDEGIDLRILARRSDQRTIVQCKHYAKSGFSNLLAKMKEEKKKVAMLAPQRYLLATTVPMSPDRKDKLVDALTPWLHDAADILGAEDLVQMLRSHPEVERAHYKLWMNSTAVLERILNNDVLVRTTGYVEDIRRKSQIYVKNDSFSEAHERLNQDHVCIIAGAPGVGKTTLAEILLVHMMAAKFEPVIISADVSEGDRMYIPGKPQVFLYDDFLGRSSSFEKLGKNEDDRLLRFMERVQRSENKRFILTTREYLLSQARADFERLDNSRIDLAKLVLDVASYTRLHRAHILYNHLYFSSLSTEALDSVVRTKAYRQVIQHENYLPRLVEDAVTLAQRQAVPADEFPTYLVDAFERPEELWRNILEQQFGRSEQVLLLMLLAIGAPETLRTLEECYFSVQSSERLARFEDAFRAVEGTAVLVRSSIFANDKPMVDFMNPGVQDAVIDRLGSRPDLLRVAILACRTFEQVLTLWAHSVGAIPKISTRSGRDSGAVMRYVRRFMRPSRTGSSSSVRTEFGRAMRANGELVIHTLGDLMLSGTQSGMLPEEHMACLVRVSSDLQASPSAVEWRRLIDYLSQRWAEGDGDKDAALDLLRSVVNFDVVPSELKSKLSQDLAAWFSATRRSTHDFVVLGDLKEILNEHMATVGTAVSYLPELHDLAEEYSAIVESELDRLYEWEGTPSELQDALDEVEELAQALGVQGVSAMAEPVRDLVQEWLAEEAGAESDAYDDWKDSRSAEPDFRDVDLLFDSLGDK